MPFALTLVMTLVLADASLQVGEHRFLRRTLDNGLEALAVDDGQGEHISVFVVYAVGNRAETAETTGLAHLTEHTLFTGTAKTPAGQHDATVKQLGGESNAYTRDDFTAYYAHRLPPAALEQVLALEADRMRGLTFGVKGFEHERERLRAEEAHTNDASVQVGAQRDEAIWRGQGYGAGILNAEGHTRGPTLSLEQVRAFYDAWYQPHNAAVVVIGVEPTQALDAIQAAFGGLPRGPRLPPRVGGPRRFRPEVELSAPLSRERLEWVWVGPSLHEAEDRLALTLLGQLFRDARARDGTPLEVWMGGRQGPDLFVLAATGPAAAEELHILRDHVLAGGWSDVELNEAKVLLRDAFTSKPLRARPYFSLAVDVAAYAAAGFPEYPVRFAERLDALSREDLLAAARRWLRPEMATLIRFQATGEAAPLPEDAAGLRAAAQAAEASGELERAIAAYERLLATKPGRVNLVIYRYSLGALNRRLGRLDEARDHLLAGLKVVEYPALRELLEEVEAERAGGAGSAGAASQPASRPAAPASRPAAAASAHKLVGSEGAEPPAWAQDAPAVMGQLEAWRGLRFRQDVALEFVPAKPELPAGWYEPDTKRLVVTLRGTERFGRGTMLHELFHALQDQHYDLVRVHAHGGAPDAERAISALIEGEAMLAVQEIMDYDFSRHAHIPAEGELDEERYRKVFHYGDGLKLVEAIRAARGWKGVQAAYADPPRHTALVFHPERYLSGWRPLGPEAFPTPALGPGETLRSSQAEGELGLRLALSRPLATRPQAPRLGAMLLGDVHHVIARGSGERHMWYLRFRQPSEGGPEPAQLREQLEAAGAALPREDRGGPVEVEQVGPDWVLRWGHGRWY